jgi:hypothetical protein
MIKLSEKERDAMAHCMGHHSSKGCSINGGRNFYAASSKEIQMWDSLVERKLAQRHITSICPTVYFLTDSGISAVEEDPRSQKEGRAYIVKYDFDEKITEVYAKTRSKAQFVIAQRISDAKNCSIGEALKLIKSCSPAMRCP